MAQNAKGGAVVVCDDGQVLYVRGLDEWSDFEPGTRVIVRGTLESVEHNAPLVDDKGLHSCGTRGPQTFIVSSSIEKE